MPRVTKTKLYNILLSFVEYGVMNPKYYDHVGGRVEIFLPNGRRDGYQDEELGYFTKAREEIEQLREKFDFKYCSLQELEYIRQLFQKLGPSNF